MPESTLTAPAGHTTARRGPDPDAPAWAAYLIRKRDECLSLVCEAFDLTRGSLLAGESEGEVATVLFAKDEERGLAGALMNLLTLTQGRFMANCARPSYSHSRGALIDRLMDRHDEGALIDDLAELEPGPAERVVVHAASNGHAAAEIPGWEER